MIVSIATRGIMCSGLGKLLTYRKSAITSLGIRGHAGGRVLVANNTSCGVDTNPSSSVYGCLGSHYCTIRTSASLCIGYGELHCGGFHFKN